MARPLTRAQTLENTAFVRALRRSGNMRLAAREIGVAYGTLQHRRKRHPAFAARIDAAIAMAEARLAAGGLQSPRAATGPGAPARTAHRTTGGETVVRGNGRARDDPKTREYIAGK